MYCKKCGAEMMEGASFCNNCGSTFGEVGGETTTDAFKGSGILALSILELFCVNFITGLVAIIIYCTSFKSAVNNGDINGAIAAKKSMKIALWIGVALWAVVIVLGIIAAVILAVAAPKPY